RAAGGPERALRHRDRLHALVRPRGEDRKRVADRAEAGHGLGRLGGHAAPPRARHRHRGPRRGPHHDQDRERRHRAAQPLKPQAYVPARRGSVRTIHASMPSVHAQITAAPSHATSVAWAENTACAPGSAAGTMSFVLLTAAWSSIGRKSRRPPWT